jgi:hypothetical protein
MEVQNFVEKVYKHLWFYYFSRLCKLEQTRNYPSGLENRPYRSPCEYPLKAVLCKENRIIKAQMIDGIK